MQPMPPGAPQAQPPLGSVAHPHDDVFYHGTANHTANWWGYTKWKLVFFGGVALATVIYVYATPVSHWAWFLLSLVGLGGFFYEYLKHRTTRFKISARRVETEHGILTKTVDSLELWRVLDVRYHQTIVDRILGNACITLIGTDQTDKELRLHGLPGHRALFEKLRDAVQVARHTSRPMEVVPGHEGQLAEFL